jgi:hypothetical protein
VDDSTPYLAFVLYPADDKEKTLLAEIYVLGNAWRRVFIVPSVVGRKLSFRKPQVLLQYAT